MAGAAAVACMDRPAKCQQRCQHDASRADRHAGSSSHGCKVRRRKLTLAQVPRPHGRGRRRSSRKDSDQQQRAQQLCHGAALVIHCLPLTVDLGQPCRGQRKHIVSVCRRTDAKPQNHAKYKVCAEGRAAAVLIHLTRSMRTPCKPLLVDCPSIGSELLTSTQAWEAPPAQLTARALAASALASVRSEGFSRCSKSNPGLRGRLPDTASGRAPSGALSLTGGQPTTADGQSSQTAARRAGSDEK